jgi:hypothetical protein
MANSVGRLVESSVVSSVSVILINIISTVVASCSVLPLYYHEHYE